MTLAGRPADDDAMRWLRANSILVLLIVTVALFMAALTWQSSPLHLAASLLVAVVVVILSREAVAQIRAWGARPAAIAIVLGLAVLALAMQVVPLVLDMGWLRVVLVVAAWGGLILAAVEPRWFVAALGGPRAEWLVLRERAALWHDVQDLSDAGLADAGAVIEDRVRAFDRFRTPRTTDYIDTFQRLAIGDEPDEAKQRIAVHFAELEEELLQSLGVPPAWEAEFEASGRATPG